MMSTAVRIFVLALVATACAQGGSGTGNPSDAGGGGTDAKPLDAFTPATDAPVLPTDAAIDGSMVLPDGPLPDGLPGGTNFLCDNNGQCTNAGECCFDFLGASEQGFCIMGTIVFGTCFPPVE